MKTHFENLFLSIIWAILTRHKQWLHFYSGLVDLQCCGPKSSWWGPRQRGRRSWAWWRPGWGWWICDDWWVCGRTREPCEAEDKRSRGRAGWKWTGCKAWALHTGWCCWRWRRRFPPEWGWSFPSSPDRRWQAEAPTEPLDPPPPPRCHHCPPRPPEVRQRQSEDCRAIRPSQWCCPSWARSIPSRLSHLPFYLCNKQS